MKEYDALPDLSQIVSTEHTPINNQKYGQGCGHILIISGAVAAAIGLKSELEAKNLQGTMICYGCPAEETLSGKPLMVRGGELKELDVAFSFHPMFNNEVSLGNLIATNSVNFHFKGISSHAATGPQNGRSAQTVAELMNIAQLSERTCSR